MKKLIIYTDGGSRGNPGPSAFGVVATTSQGKVVFKQGEYIGTTTNNVAEYQGLLHALMAGKSLGASHLEIRMDSELIVKQMHGLYKIKQPHLQDLAKKVRHLLADFEVVEFVHVRREKNQQADSMVNLALDEHLAHS